MRESLAKAEYLFRPDQLARRLRLAVTGVPDRELTVRLPWGWPLRVNPSENIGRAIVTLGIYDLVVAEALHRLLSPGETAVDVGANIGSMAAVLARRSASGGSVHAFEPHPELYSKLTANVASWKGSGCVAGVECHALALSDREGEAELHVPESFAVNSGLSSLSRSTRGSSLSVRTATLDGFFRSRPIPALLKLDVEGHEAAVLKGARTLLASGRVRDILFEENDPVHDESRGLLKAAGYHVFLLGRGLFRPSLRLLTHEAASGAWEPPTLLATLDPARAKSRLSSWGWRVLSRR